MTVRMTRLGLRDRLQIRRLRGRDRLMIVAHPDDETLWGGVTLADEAGWGVVCLTNRGASKRRQDFSAAMHILGTVGAIFDVPDRSSTPPTDGDRTQVTAIVEQALAVSGAREVMTHGPDGEYGHHFHRLVHDVVVTVLARPEHAGLTLQVFNFDPAVDVSVSRPAAWAKKQAATTGYLGDDAHMPASDRCHVALGRHESPVAAVDYVRPWDLVRTMYADSGMDIT